MDDLIQLLRVTPATEIAKKWNVNDARLNEIVGTYKLPLYAIREKRIRPNDDKTVYFCSGPSFNFYYEGEYGHGDYVLEGEYFNTDNVEKFETEHPEVLWDPSPEEDEAEQIPAEEVRKQLRMSPIQFVDMLNGKKEARLRTSWEEWYRDSDSHWFDTAKIDDIAIHRLDLEEYMQLCAQQLEAVPSRTPDGKIDFSAVLKPEYTELEKQLTTAQKQIEELQPLRQWNKRLNEQNQELRAAGQKKDDRITELEALPAVTPKKDTSAATITKLRKDLQRWKDAIGIIVPVAMACQEEGEKKRTRQELKNLCKRQGGELPNAQLDALRDALPDNYVDKKDRAEASPDNDESLE